MAVSRRGGRGERVGSLISTQMGILGYSDKIREHMAPRVWAEVVGPQIASATEVERVREGVLWVHTRSAMWASELNFYKADILRRLNERVGASPGHPLLKDIRFQNKGIAPRGDTEVPPAAHPRPEELDDIEISSADLAALDRSLAAIPDARLRQTVRRARITDAKVRSWRMENGWSPCPDCQELSPPRFPYDGTLDCARCRFLRRQGDPDAYRPA